MKHGQVRRFGKDIRDYQFTADWFGGNIPNWRAWLGWLAGKPYVKFLEIGCYEGRDTVWLLDNILTHETARIDCVDIFVENASEQGGTDGYEKRFDHNIKLALGRKKLKKIKACAYQ